MSTPTPPPSSAPKPTARVCKCGHDRHHPMVSADPKYSGFGWAAILTGISASAKSMSFRCRVCDEILETITDPEEMKKVRIYG